jgi:hypothetical protein
LYGFKQLDAEYLIYNRSVVKTFYDGESVSEWLLRSLGWWIANPWLNPMITDLKKLKRL